MEGLGVEVRERGRSSGHIVQRHSSLGSTTGNTILTVDDVEAGPHSMEVNPKSTLHWQSFWKEKRKHLWRIPHEAHDRNLGGNL